jgi:hypothetical protein
MLTIETKLVRKGGDEIGKIYSFLTHLEKNQQCEQ